MLSENRIRFARLVSRLRYRYSKEKVEKPILFKKHIDQLQRIIGSAFIVWPDFMKQARDYTRAVSARKRKKNRANKYIRGMFDSYDTLHFVTLTFSPESLEKLSYTTRRRYTREWLETNCRDYCANIDYGKKNGREHYHALVALPKSGTYQPWPYGFQKVRLFHMPEDSSPAKISGYICKLANHAGKLESGKMLFKLGGFKDVDEIPF